MTTPDVDVLAPGHSALGWVRRRLIGNKIGNAFDLLVAIKMEGNSDKSLNGKSLCNLHQSKFCPPS
eukprot:3633754-Ditylum_brightwellii.AAC.1